MRRRSDGTFALSPSPGGGPAPTKRTRVFGGGNVLITVNGQAREAHDSLTVTELLAEMELPSVRVAVELNESLVPRRAYAHTALRTGDRLEVVTFVGGG